MLLLSSLSLSLLGPWAQKAVLGKWVCHLQSMQSIRSCGVRMAPARGAAQHLQGREQDVLTVGYRHGLRSSLWLHGCWPVLAGLSRVCAALSSWV